MIETLTQRRVALAYQLVNAKASLPTQQVAAYGRLCHRFPMMVLQGGLLTAVQFAEDKTSGNGAQSRAFKALLSDVREVLGFEQGAGLSATLADKQATAIMAYTMTVLQVFSSMRRFAVSVLKVEAAGDVDEGIDEQDAGV